MTGMGNRLMKALLIVILGICSLSIGLSAQAQLYKWVDEKGRVHYSDQKQDGVQLQDVKGTVNSYEAVTYDESLFTHADKVVIYTRPTCGYCNKAKAFFARNGIQYKEYKVESSSLAKKKYARLNATGVPVIFVGKKRMNGFSASQFEKMFCKQTSPCELG
jgi:glutaredoxin